MLMLGTQRKGWALWKGNKYLLSIIHSGASLRGDDTADSLAGSIARACQDLICDCFQVNLFAPCKDRRVSQSLLLFSTKDSAQRDQR